MRADRTAIVHFGSQVGRTFAGFVGTLYIARTLGSAPLGTYVLGTAVVIWLHIPTNAVAEAMTKRVSEGEAPAEFLTAGFVVIGALAAVVGGCVLVLDTVVEGYIGADVAALMAALFAGRALFIAVTRGLDGQKKVAHSGMIRMVEQVFRSLFQIALIIVGYDVAGLFIGHVGALVVSSLVGIWLFEEGFATPVRRHFRKIAEYARYSWLGRVQSRSLDWIDTLVLGLFVPTSLIGIYEVAWTLASTLSLVTISIATTLFPEVSELSAEGTIERIRTLLGDAMVFAGLFVIPGLFGAAVMGDRILAIYGPEFTAGVAVLVLLVGTRICTSYSTLFLKTINGLDRPDISFRIAVAFLSVNLVLNLLLVATIGWVGAAIATLVSAATSVTLSYYSVVTVVGDLNVPTATIGKQVLASVLMAGVVVALDRALSSNHYVTVAIVGVAATLYIVVLLSISSQVRSRLLAVVSRP